MNEPILCLAVLFFLGWIIYLKYQMGELRKENDALRSRLKVQVKKAIEGVEVPKEAGVAGHKPGWLK